VTAANLDLDSDERASAQYPGARLPERRRSVHSLGVNLAVSEWGDEKAPVLFCSHGGFDFTGTFDVFAPLLAAAGWRVVAWDQRGHGDSDHAPLYSWDADVRDLLNVLDSTTREPAVLLGHSKGGSISTYAIQAAPHRVRAFVNIDGIPSHRPPPDVADHERTKLLATELSGWLDHRRGAGEKVRRADTLAGLAERRGRMNPRLSKAWLRYLVTRGARKDADGWRWKIDPVLRPGGFGPWRAQWSMARLASLPVPLLGLLATENEPMGWDTAPADVKPYLPRRAELVQMEGAGHFIHIEQPERTAKLVLDFLRSAGA
jgi:pimeloyl-ACP methyl ester carboxylesterase